jgi:hypothetical protein
LTARAGRCSSTFSSGPEGISWEIRRIG